MFNSTILDVAVGMIFVYLLLSLMCSAANEIIELMLKKRAIDLERGIRELLAPGSKSGTPDIVQKLYDHSLVNNLFGRTYGESRIDSRLRVVMRTQLPSYIPARSFALALMDLVGTTPAPGSTAKGTPEVTTPVESTAQPPSGASGATIAPAQIAPSQVINLLTGKGEEGTSSTSVPGTPAPPGTPASAAVPGSPLASLRKAVSDNQLLTDVSRRALITLLDASGNDVAKARENIENWYNASMDRVSSWYKRRAQVTILILGLFVAITVNVDTITVAKRLSIDKALRDSLVAASDAYAKANATASSAATPSHGTTATPPKPSASLAASPGAEPASTAPNTSAADASPSPSAAPTVSPSGSPSAVAANVSSAPTLPAACVEDADSAECKRAKDLEEACKDQEDSPKCKYLTNQQQLQALGLPIGWDDKNDPKRNWTGWTWVGDRGGWWDQLRWHWLGWFLTALAISLGAPFWFDILNKFIVIRSAVKPHEKSPEEESKD